MSKITKKHIDQAIKYAYSMDTSVLEWALIQQIEFPLKKRMWTRLAALQVLKVIVGNHGFVLVLIDNELRLKERGWDIDY